MDPLLGAPATAAQLLCPERLRAEHCCEMRRGREVGNVEHGGSARHGAGSGEQGAALRGRDAPTLSFPQGPLFSSPPPGDNISFPRAIGRCWGARPVPALHPGLGDTCGERTPVHRVPCCDALSTCRRGTPGFRRLPCQGKVSSTLRVQGMAISMRGHSAGQLVQPADGEEGSPGPTSAPNCRAGQEDAQKSACCAPVLAGPLPQHPASHGPAPTPPREHPAPPAVPQPCPGAASSTHVPRKPPAAHVPGAEGAITSLPCL